MCYGSNPKLLQDIRFTDLLFVSSFFFNVDSMVIGARYLILFYRYLMHKCLNIPCYNIYRWLSHSTILNANSSGVLHLCEDYGIYSLKPDSLLRGWYNGRHITRLEEARDSFTLHGAMILRHSIAGHRDALEFSLQSFPTTTKATFLRFLLLILLRKLREKKSRYYFQSIQNSLKRREIWFLAGFRMCVFHFKLFKAL